MAAEENHEKKHDTWGERWMRVVWRKPAASLAELTRRRVTVHLLPYLFFLYILAYLDRANVSAAKFGMTKSPADGGLGITSAAVGWGLGIFFWGYWVLEVPSTLSVAKWGARWVFVRILVLWGLCATLVGFIGMPWMNDLFALLPHLHDSGTGWWSATRGCCG